MSWIGVVTNGGKSIIASSFAGTTLNIDSAGGGTGTISEAALMSQTALVTQKQTLSIIQNESVSGGIRLKVQITAPATGYILNQLGIWASLDGGTSTLLALFQNSDGVSIPSSADMPDFIYTFFGVIEMSNEGTLTVTIDTSALISQSTMNTAITAHDEDASAHADLFASAVSAAAADATAKADAAEAAAKLASVPTTRRINGKPLSADVTLTGADIGVSGKKVARFIIGTSTAGWSADDCDYLCDGIADQLQFNAAIAALPSTGGEIFALDGTYNVTAAIDLIKNSITISGSGPATIIKRAWSSTGISGIIQSTGPSNNVIRNLQLDGDKTNWGSSNNHGLWLFGSSNNLITGVTFVNHIHAIDIGNGGAQNRIIGNLFDNCTQGIFLDYVNDNIISANNAIEGSLIWMFGAFKNSITGNYGSGGESAVHLMSSEGNTITGNVLNDNVTDAIYLYGSSKNSIVGNSCFAGYGNPGDYSDYRFTIHLDGTSNNYNLVIANNCKGKAPVDGGGSENILVNNLS